MTGATELLDADLSTVIYELIDLQNTYVKARVIQKLCQHLHLTQKKKGGT